MSTGGVRGIPFIHRKPRVCLPGEPLYPADASHASGCGTYVSHGQIYASLAGYLHVSEPGPARKDDAELGENGDVRHQSAPRELSADTPHTSLIEVWRTQQRDRNRVPAVGSVVTAKVTFISQRFAKCLILCVENVVMAHPFNALLRKEDVRATDTDRVEMQRCYRPGDLILARVLSSGGESRTDSSFIVSTAEDQLGVVSAVCDEGHRMVPTTWTQMKCTETGALEERKVAKVPHLLASL